MSQTPRKKRPGEGFKDPLKNYDPPKHKDPLEKSLTEETVEAIESRPFRAVRPDLPIHAALKALVGLEIACLLVSEDERLLGVFTERDVLDKVAGRYEEIKDRPVSEVMTPEPVFAYETDSAGAALSVMAVSGFRHVPVLDVDDKIVGIVSPPRVTAFLQQHFGRR
jgi:CBS domain-containing protein